MTTNRASELLYDTASTLRLLDAELGELAPRRAPETAVVPAAPAAPEIGPMETVLPMLPGLLLRAMVEVHAMLHSIRAERDQIRAATSDRLAHTGQKLNEVSSATACAARDIMDSIDRAVARVDDLESPAVAADPELRVLGASGDRVIVGVPQIARADDAVVTQPPIRLVAVDMHGALLVQQMVGRRGEAARAGQCRKNMRVAIDDRVVGRHGGLRCFGVGRDGRADHRRKG